MLVLVTHLNLKPFPDLMNLVGASVVALLNAAVMRPRGYGRLSLLFAATYPERTSSLILYGAIAHFLSWVVPAHRLDASIAGIEHVWGTGESLKLFAPNAYADVAFRTWWARFERIGASPAAVMDLMRMNSEIDVRSILPSIHVPTLVLHRARDTRVNVESGRYFSRNIPGAKYMGLPGEDHVLWAADTGPVADEIEEFLTGTRAASERDRVLATVMFTDIVNSTIRASELGDRRWRDLLDAHDRIVREEIMRQRGREVKSLGDGFLAVFDGPARGVRCAISIAQAAQAKLDLAVRGGLHTGEIEVTGDDVRGIAVHMAARVAGHASAGEVLVSRTVKDLVAGSGLKFQDYGKHHLKGFQEEARLFAVSL